MAVREINLYGELGEYGTSTEEFAGQLSGSRAGDLVVTTIDSYGGDAFCGVSICNLLIASPADVEVRVVGLAASAASIAAMGGDRILMAPSAFLMIHSPWSIAAGNADDLRSMAETLDALNEALVDTYATRRFLDRDQVAEWVAAETWFSAEEAVEVGMADEVTERFTAEATAKPIRRSPTFAAERKRVEQLQQDKRDRLAASRHQREEVLARHLASR